MADVLTYLQALAGGIGKQDEDITFSFYANAHNLLKTREQQEAFMYGALAMFADIGKMRLRAFYYRHKFKKAMEKLKE